MIINISEKKIIQNTLILFVWAILAIPTQAQVDGQLLDIPITKLDGSTVQFDNLGGMNLPQYSEIDFNRDGIMDLCAYDRASGIFIPFVNGGTPNTVDYSLANEYRDIFPKDLKKWALLRDYNNDGVMDVFAFSTIPGIAGIEVHKGAYDASSGWSFTKVQNFNASWDLITYPSSSGSQVPLYVSADDIPTIDDVDGDGDIDVLTFSIVGSKMEYYENQSVQMGYGADSLVFSLADQCWGQFIEAGSNSSITLSDNAMQCADLNRGAGLSSPRHTGSTSTIFDADDDGDKDILIGDIGSNRLVFMENGGGNWMNQKDDNFPSYSTTLDIPIFPMPFIMDVNNDGKEDFLAAPNGNGSSVNINVTHYYENTAATGSNFSFVQDDFLNGGGLDVGQRSKPAFFDYNADGLLDIVVGTDGFFQSIATYDARLILLENIGTATSPAYEVVDEDWLGFSAYSDRNLAPTFGDLDSDGDLDLLVGHNAGKLFYAENTGGTGAAVFNTVIVEYKSIFGGSEVVPEIVDLDGDGLNDILTGYKQGRAAFFKNIGTSTAPDFNPDRTVSPNIDGLGMIDTRKELGGFFALEGYCSPRVYYTDGVPYLLVGSFYGAIHQYENIQGNLTGTFTEVTDNYANIYEGHETSFDIADMDDDGYYEIVVGNTRGGLSFYDTGLKILSTSIEEHSLAMDWDLFPNPTSEILEFRSDDENMDVEISISDVSGKRMMPKQKGRQLNLSHLPTGIYIASVYINNVPYSKKIVKL